MEIDICLTLKEILIGCGILYAVVSYIIMIFGCRRMVKNAKIRHERFYTTIKFDFDGPEVFLIKVSYIISPIFMPFYLSNYIITKLVTPLEFSK